MDQNNMSTEQIKKFMDRVKEIEKNEKVDLSSGEDLSIAVMNLISIEEHLFFSGGKTGKVKYYELLKETREMRKKLMKDLVPSYEGEEWCISKHILAASMRIMEVGTKFLGKGDDAKAQELFRNAYEVYGMFWAMRLGIADKKEIKKDEAFSGKDDKPAEMAEKTFFGKMGDVWNKILDCCRE